ncbi:hypothetical protein B0T22DRAFT_444794 [Podospora appendiculata]|uniref:Clr5 domain-containing protein n=1 Tax=Podospora appendiculata TaxID=314037 RepID=A0AAE1C8A5_9PEZI|nr:hypothetical protein B0T22DRAFT_444794 [Podospora appendiculata]
MTKSWEDHKEVIVRQYKEQNKPLHVVRRFMEEQYRFKASNTTAKFGKLSAANEFPSAIAFHQTPDSENSSSSSSSGSPESPTMKSYFVTGAQSGIETSSGRVGSTGLNLGFNSRSYCGQFATSPTQHMNTQPVFIAHHQPRGSIIPLILTPNEG